MTNTNEVMEVFEAAKIAAEKQVKGHLFVGAWGEAENAGFEKGTENHDLFTAMFLQLIRNIDIIVDDNGIMI